MLTMKRILFIWTIFILSLSCDRIFDPYFQTEVYYHPKFTEEENQKMTMLLNKIESTVKVDFYSKFRAWKKTWDDEVYWVCSNPRCWTQSDQYKALLSFCQAQGKTIWPLVFKSHFENEREYLTALLLEDLTFPEYSYLVEEVREEIEKSEDKPYQDFWVLYIRKVLKFL